MAPKPVFDELRTVLFACRGYFLTAAVFSLGINLLYLAAPLYMLQIYDRVIASASHLTLLMLTLVLLAALGALAGLDLVRARVLIRSSIRLDRMLGDRVVAATIEAAGRGRLGGLQVLRDFDTFRQFVAGAGILALFDMPWAPIYLVVIFALHPLLGAFALGCAVLLGVMALINERVVNQPLTQSNDAATKTYAFTESSLRNAEVVQAMGMSPGLLQRWRSDRNRMIERQTVASNRGATTSNVIKFLRQAMQSLILAVGAWLVIERQVTVGAMFAASILLGRALQPVELAVGSWRTIVSARQSYRRVRQLFLEHPLRGEVVVLPRPDGRLSVEEVLYTPERGGKLILRGVSFRLEPGEVLGVIGPSGAGKSTLARLLTGVLAPSSGVVRLDGADVSIWPREQFGNHIGYLPQDIELFPDSIAANISRFRGDADDSEIVEAARMAGVYELILRLPQGFETRVGEAGSVLSGGIRQRVGLARAVYGNPSLVVLDEPSSNLDSDGDIALLSCIADLKSRGTTVVMITHRPNTLGAVDKLLLLRDGQVETMGPRDEIIQRLSQSAPRVQVVRNK